MMCWLPGCAQCHSATLRFTASGGPDQVCDDLTFKKKICIMLLFDHKQHLQSYNPQSSMQRKIFSFKEIANGWY